jgi:hypothetical protein
VKRLVTIIVLVILVIGLVLVGLDDEDASVADTGIPHDEMATNQTQTSNPSATANTTITMHTGDV